MISAELCVYARNNTVLPAVVGVISVAIYMGVALWALPDSYGLVWGDTAKQAERRDHDRCALVASGAIGGDLHRQSKF